MKLNDLLNRKMRITLAKVLVVACGVISASSLKPSRDNHLHNQPHERRGFTHRDGYNRWDAGTVDGRQLPVRQPDGVFRSVFLSDRGAEYRALPGRFRGVQNGT